MLLGDCTHVCGAKLVSAVMARDYQDVSIAARELLQTRPTAKRLILSVLSQPNMAVLPIRQLVAWGALFDQKPAAIRVTAGRLVNELLLEKTARGMYTIGASGLALKAKASEWTVALDQVRAWQSGWYVVHTGHLGKAVRRNVRARERAFRLLGFKELVEGLWVRPDNLRLDQAQMFEKLCQLGLDSGAVLLRSDHLVGDHTDALFDLWRHKDLNRGYDFAAALLAQSQKRLQGESLHRITRETFLIGEHVIRLISTDPLLPEGQIDAGKRQAMVDAMTHYSEFCDPYWAEFLDRAADRSQ